MALLNWGSWRLFEPYFESQGLRLLDQMLDWGSWVKLSQKQCSLAHYPTRSMSFEKVWNKTPPSLSTPGIRPRLLWKHICTKRKFAIKHRRCCSSRLANCRAYAAKTRSLVCVGCSRKSRTNFVTEAYRTAYKWTSLVGCRISRWERSQWWGLGGGRGKALKW